VVVSGRTLLRALAVGLALPESSFDQALQSHTMSTLRLNYYPRQPDDAKPVTTDANVALRHVPANLVTTVLFVPID
jgi:isopenicillin N synthase-like dioxygenase